MGGGFNSGSNLPSGGGFSTGPAFHGGGSFQGPSAFRGSNAFQDHSTGQTASNRPDVSGGMRHIHGRHFFGGAGGYDYSYNCTPYWNGYTYVYPNGYACGYGATY